MSYRDLREKYGIRLKKGLGQNLLLDENINAIMVDAAALNSADAVFEVGAGLGALTERLGAAAGRVLALEIDASFMPCLEDKFAPDSNVTLFRGDILNHSVSRLAEEFLPGADTYKMVSNLPYYITTPILFHFWESPLFCERAVVMVQEEVGQRLVTPVGSSEYGKLALTARYYSEIDIVHKVSRNCFKPRPKVDSCIVRLRNRAEPLYPGLERANLMRLIAAAFSQRRKTLRNSLTRSKVYGVPKEIVLESMEAATIDPGRRPQTLTLDEFADLAREIQKRSCQPCAAPGKAVTGSP